MNRIVGAGLAMFAMGFATLGVAQDAGKSALLAVEQHRASIVKRIVDDWRQALLAAPTPLARTPEELSQKLSGLRADRLLAASLAGSFDTVAEMLSASAAEGAGAMAGGKPRTKALGEQFDDLAYTPLTPCRIVDTRNAGGQLVPNSIRVFDGYNPSSFAFQGGAASTCNIPLGVNALVMNVAAVQPATPGFINIWPANATQPNASIVNFGSEFALAAGTIMGVDGATQNRFVAVSPASVDLVVDVVGYFRRPTNYGGFTSVGTSYATVNGGFNNTAASGFSAVGGGSANVAAAPSATVAGGSNNVAGGAGYAAIGGGFNNNSSGYASAIAGGYANLAVGLRTAIGGGYSNGAGGDSSTVAGGQANNANALGAAIGGGFGNYALGNYSVVPGGYQSYASGNTSLAAGTRAKTVNSNVSPTHYDGVFIWADASNAGVDFFASANHEFAARATGGVRFVTAIDLAGVPAAGVTLASGGGAWATLSDVAAKHELAPVDARDILDRVARMPIYSWKYRTETSGARHVGPTAQDFRAAFTLGDSDKTITTVDADGVALAAIQGLRELVVTRERRIETLERELAAIKVRLGME